MANSTEQLMTKLENSPMTSMPVVTYPGKEFSSSLSPNSQEVVFSWNGGSGTTSSLYEKVVGSEQYLRLTTVANAIDFDPVWSPDGRETQVSQQRDRLSDFVIHLQEKHGVNLRG